VTSHRRGKILLTTTASVPALLREMKLGLLNVAIVPSPFESGEDICDRPASVVTALDDTLMARTVWK
jgi:hypothetical protein